MNKLFIRIFHRDRWSNGILAGIFIPIVLLAGMLYLFESLGLLTTEQSNQVIHILRPRTLALLALCANVILMQTFRSLRWDQSMRGIAVATFICVALWLAKYYHELF
jgi:chromate transport protein ChrA